MANERKMITDHVIMQIGPKERMNRPRDPNDPNQNPDPDASNPLFIGLQALPFRRELEEPQRELSQEQFAEAIKNSGYPILCKTISRSAVDPLNLQPQQLPAILLGYGPAFINPNITQVTQVRGETLTFILNVIFETYHKDKFLMETAARWHDAIGMFIPRLNTTLVMDGVEVALRDARLQSVSPFSEGLSDREFLRFAIEVDWVYPA